MHTSHCVSHTVGSRAGCHVVRMQGTACTAAGCHGEILFALLYAFLLIGSCNRVLESGWVGVVTGNRNIHAFLPHDSNAFCYVVSAVAVNLCTKSLGVRLSPQLLYLACIVIHLCLYIGKSIDS